MNVEERESSCGMVGLAVLMLLMLGLLENEKDGRVALNRGVDAVAGVN